MLKLHTSKLQYKGILIMMTLGCLTNYIASNNQNTFYFSSNSCKHLSHNTEFMMNIRTYVRSFI